MDAFLRMDIFFVVTTVVVAIAGIFIILALYYVTHILRDIRDITSTVRKEAKEIAADFHEVRTDIKGGVHEVREKVTEGVETAKTYSQVVAGTGIVKAFAGLLEAFGEEKTQQKKRHTKRKKATKKD